MKTNSIVYNKAFNFAIKTIQLYKFLCEEKKEYVLSKQLLKSGTSIGANIKEGLVAQSKKDFISKMHIAYKEASESEYWLELLIQTNYLDNQRGNELMRDLNEITKLLSAIIMTAKNRLDK